MADPIETLKASRWWNAAVRKFASHVQAAKRQGCPELHEQFGMFAADILNMPEQHRDEILTIDEAEYSEPARRYRQYDQPIQSEMKISTVTKRRRR